jgi:hypothetical protein
MVQFDEQELAQLVMTQMAANPTVKRPQVTQMIEPRLPKHVNF